MEYDFLCIMIIINKVDWENLKKRKRKVECFTNILLQNFASVHFLKCLNVTKIK